MFTGKDAAARAKRRSTGALQNAHALAVPDRLSHLFLLRLGLVI
jgi:hypothetical protein